MGQSLLGNNRANISQCPRKQQSESLLLRLRHFTMFESPKMQRAGQRPVSWVNIPITRTVNNIMANVVEELQQHQKQVCLTLKILLIIIIKTEQVKHHINNTTA